jgi:xanthine dehydrogenase accessory factor
MSKHAKMAVLTDGSIAGTIGGGKLEADVIQTAMQGMAGREAALFSFELTSEQVESDGLTCGGTVEVLVEYFVPDISLPIVEALAAIYEQGQSGVAVTILPPDRQTAPLPVVAGQRLLVHADKTLTGTTGKSAIDAQIIQCALTYLGDDYLGIHSLNIQGAETVRLFLETIVPRPIVYLLGGGHISYHLAQLLPRLDFDFVVVDDRETFANQQRFPEAKDCVVHTFDDVFDALHITPQVAYIVIVTRGHQFDFEVLQQALRVAPRYVGMIGSRRKIKILFEQLQQQGVAQETLEAVHAPIGLEIGADTPEEIAISIAAELISVRRATG